MCDAYFSLHRYCLTNPNVEGMKNWIPNNISKLHDNPTINEFKIVVLPRQFWVSMEKEKATMWSIFLSAWTLFRYFQRWECLELSSEPRSRNSQWSNGEWIRDRRFYETGLVICGKRESKTKLRGRGGSETIVSLNWPNISVFIARVLATYYLLYFFFYHLIKTNFILFPIKWINQLFFFLQIIILIQLFPFIYLIIKISSFSKTLFFLY